MTNAEHVKRWSRDELEARYRDAEETIAELRRMLEQTYGGGEIERRKRWWQTYNAVLRPADPNTQHDGWIEGPHTAAEAQANRAHGKLLTEPRS